MIISDSTKNREHGPGAFISPNLCIIFFLPNFVREGGQLQPALRYAGFLVDLDRTFFIPVDVVSLTYSPFSFSFSIHKNITANTMPV